MVLETSFPPDKRVENEIDSLIIAGHSITLLCSARDGEKLYEEQNGLIIRRVRMSSFIRKSSVGALSFPFYHSFWRRRIRRILRDRHFDYLHLHDLPLAKVITDLRLEFGFSMVLDLHENWPALLDVSQHTKSLAGRILSNNAKWRDYEREYVSQADHVIVVIEELRDRLTSLTGRSANLHVVKNTLNINELTNMNIKEKKSSDKDKLILLYSGGITFHRGLQYVLKALSRIPENQSKIEFRIAGSGSYLNEIKEIATKLSLDDCVRFYGWVRQQEVFELQSEADATIIPHIKSEQTDAGMPHKMFQYMYFNKPVISSDCTPAERIITETGAGFVYRYDDDGELAAILNSIIENREILDRFRNGREMVESKYNWSEDSKVLTDIYR